MSSTKSTKSVLGHKASIQQSKKSYVSTLSIGVISSEKIKIVHKGDDMEITSGYSKVDVSEKKRKEIYKKINKMLGGI